MEELGYMFGRMLAIAVLVAIPVGIVILVKKLSKKKGKPVPPTTQVD